MSHYFAAWRSAPGVSRCGLCFPCWAICVISLFVADATRAQVEISGLDEASEINALIYLRLDDEACDAPEWRVRERFADAPAEIGTAMQAFGFYDARVVSELSFSEACWAASFRVEPGEPVRLREVDVAVLGAAAEDRSFAATVGAHPLVEGEPLNHGTYERLKRALLDLAQERGYAEAELAASRIDVYPADLAADITLHFTSGPRYSFGEIRVSQAVLEEELLDRYFSFSQGQPYDGRQLSLLYAALVDSGYFMSVDVRPLGPQREARQIPVSVSLQAARTRAMRYGIGFATDTGPRLRIERSNRRLNERGHQFTLNALLSPVISEITANYRYPYGDPRSEWISFDAGIKHEKTESVDSDSIQLGARRVVARYSGWRETRFVDFLIEDFEVGVQADRAQLLIPGVSWLKAEADDSIRPERGYRIGLELRGAADGVGSDTSLLQVTAQGKWIWSMLNDSRFILRAQLGATKVERFSSLPPSVRFFAGGDNSVRGYEYESLGPRDESGQVIGGSNLAIASVEYEHPLNRRWSIAAFVDSGNAFNGTDLEPKSGAGVGFRWQSPLGPIRVDLAKPLNNADRSLRLHVSLGPDL